jgi:hypothetical protein
MESIAFVNLPFANALEPWRPMQAPNRRVVRLAALVSEAGGPAEFVRKHRHPSAEKPIDASYISQILNGHRSFGEKAARNMEAQAGLPHGYFDADPGPIPALERHPPVVGTAQLGDDGYWHELQYPTGHGEGFVRYPMRDPNTYALRVKGDSMRPRIKPGEFVVIEPNHSVTPGDEVMVQTKDGRSMVKLLAFQRGGMVELHSINEDHRPISLDASQIEKIHYVGGILKASMYYERT